MACESCNEQIEGVCKDFLNTDCVYISEELTCTGVQPNTVLTAALKRIDDVICGIKNKVSGTFSLLNIGDGAEIYEGLSPIGERQLRTLTSNDGTVDIVEGTDTIDFSVTIDFPDLPIASEEKQGIARIATQEEVNLGDDDTTIVTPFKLQSFLDENNNDYGIQINEGNLEFLKNGDVIDSEPLPTGENKFVTSFTINGSSLVLTFNDGTSISRDISSLLNFTQVQSDFTEENTAEPSYIKNRNPNKTVNANYVVTNADNNYVIVVDSQNDVTITVPSTINNRVAVGFIQKGTGLVTIANTDIVPSGMANTIKGQGHQAFVEKIEGTTFLFGSLNKEA